MEENNEVKRVNLKKDDNLKDRPEKMSYEQLENIAHQLSEQVQQLYAKLQESNMVNAFKRLDYLFKVLENSTEFKEEFVSKCAAEIESVMTITPEEDQNPKE